jgi:Fe-S-cluster containining protein
MLKHDTDLIMDTQFDPIDIDDSFRFGCHACVPCFNACCRDLTQFLTPYDILRLKNHFKMTSEAFLKKYTIQHDGPESGLPVITLLPGDRDQKTCPFVSPQGCLVYEDRPSSCRIYPVARAISRNRETGGITEHFAIIRESHCEGFSEGSVQPVREWIKQQGLTEYFAMNDRLMLIISMKNQRSPGPLGLKDRLLFHTALYDLDAFRRQVIEKGLLEPLGIDTTEMETIIKNDARLLEWGHRWVAFALFRKQVKEGFYEF